LEKIKPEDIHQIIGQKAKVGIGNACAEPQTIVDILVQEKDRFESLEIYGMILYWSERFVRHHLEERFKLKSFMIDRFTLEGAKRGTVEYIPCRYSQIPGLFHKKIIPLDVALVSLSPPNSRGNCSFGVSSDFTLAMAKSAKRVIVEINRQMPRVYGDSFMNVREIDYFFDSDRMLPQVPRAALGEKDRQIGRHAAELVDDGATVQIGIGRLSEGVLSCLKHKKHLGVHSGLLTDGVVDLVERGVVDNSRKGLKNGKIVTTTMVGTDKLFRFVDRNRAVESYPSDYTHNQVTLSKINRLHAINTAIQVDLMGQVNAESIGGVQVSGVGGQTDFFCGAALSKGGKSIIVIQSTSGNEAGSKIVPRLEHGASVTNLRHDVDFVVTEYGIAHLTGMTLRERARALTAVAHPKFRDWLETERRDLFP